MIVPVPVHCFSLTFLNTRLIVFCRSLLEELKSLNLVIPEVETEDGKEMETASTSHGIRGVLTDRYVESCHSGG